MSSVALSISQDKVDAHTHKVSLNVTTEKQEPHLSPQALYRILTEAQESLKLQHPDVIFPEPLLLEDASLGSITLRKGVKVSTLVRAATSLQQLRSQNPKKKPLNLVPEAFMETVANLTNLLLFQPPDELRDQEYYEGFLSRFCEALTQTLSQSEVNPKLTALRDLWAITLALVVKSQGRDFEGTFWLERLADAEPSPASALEEVIQNSTNKPPLPTQSEMDGGEPTHPISNNTYWALQQVSKETPNTLKGEQLQDFIERSQTLLLILDSMDFQPPDSLKALIQHASDQTLGTQQS